ncbi:MAG: 5'-methylthioadenosine/adenosylhomocysteine nucleosidase [Pseudomonadota bacterium]
MTRTAILSALIDEQRSLIAALENAEQVSHAGRRFNLGTLYGQPVVLGLSRIGKVAAATTATALIEKFGATRMLFTGVAGGLGPGVNVGDLVLAEEFIQHDLDSSPIVPRYEVPLYGKSRFATDTALNALLLQSATTVFAQADTWLDATVRQTYGIAEMRIHGGLVASGDRFVSTSAESRRLQQELPDALAVEMEGAAVAQVCFDYGLPFAAIRTISDRADDDAHANFSNFVRDVASHYSHAVLAGFLQSL